MTKLKPYRFVPINREVKRENIRGRDLLRKDLYSGKIKLRIQVIRPVIISSGHLTIHNNRLMGGMILLRDKPVIPGSSLKGVTRSIFEAVTYSCISPPKLNFINSEKYISEKNNSPCSHSVCPACQVFGYVNRSNHLSSLIQFTDMELAGDKEEWIEVRKIPTLYQPFPNKKAIGNYIDNDELFQRKFYTHGILQDIGGSEYTVIKEDASFTGDIHFQNLKREEIGAFLFSLGLSETHPFSLKIGYGKPAFFGSIQVILEEVIPYQSFMFTNKDFTKDELIRAANDFGKDDAFINKQKLKIAEIFNFESNKNNQWSIDSEGNKVY